MLSWVRKIRTILTNMQNAHWVGFLIKNIFINKCKWPLLDTGYMPMRFNYKGHQGMMRVASV